MLKLLVKSYTIRPGAKRSISPRRIKTMPPMSLQYFAYFWPKLLLTANAAMLKIIKSTLESGEDVLISSFGKFCVKKKKKRRGRNPATGEDMILAPKKVVTFHCSGILRERINDN